MYNRKFFLVWEACSSANIHRQRENNSKKEEEENAHEEETNSRDYRRSLGQGRSNKMDQKKIKDRR